MTAPYNLFHFDSLKAKTRQILFSSLIALLLTSYSSWTPANNDARRNFNVCLTGEQSEVGCNNLLRFSVVKKKGSFLPEEKYYPDSDIPEGFFLLKLPGNEKILDRFSDGTHDVKVNISSESIEEKFARYYEIKTLNHGRRIQRAEGNLVSVAESDPGKFGDELFIPESGEKSIFIECVRPFRTMNGDIETDVGCRVHTILTPNVFITYSIGRLYLQEWRSINAALLSEISNVMSVN